MTIRVKVCCIGSVEEAELAIRHGASAIGLVSAMPSGPGVIPEERIGEISRAVDGRASTFLLTSLTDPDSIAEQHRRCGTDVIQICDRLPDGAHRTLRRELPGVSLVQVIHVTGPEAASEAVSVATDVDALLLDSGEPGGSVPSLGGTGRTHDWAVSRSIRDSVGVPVYLAGGLDASNVDAGIRAVRPYGVDACSGFRTQGRLDETKLTAFMDAVRSAAPGSDVPSRADRGSGDGG